MCVCINLPFHAKKGTEVLFHRYFLSSSCRTEDPEKADFFFVPVYGTCIFTKASVSSTLRASKSLTPT